MTATGKAAPQVSTAVAPPEPLIAIVAIDRQSLDVWSAGGLVATTRVSTGKPGHATPTGVFSVLQRSRYHESNLYSNAPMPYMQRLTWSGIALHEGVVPNYPASHGCIRLPAGFAPKLWGLGRIGMRVIVAPTSVAPRSIQHARLPTPMAPPPIEPPTLHVLVSARGDGNEVQSGPTTLSPFAAAHGQLAVTAAERARAEKAVKPALERAAAASAAVQAAAAALRAATAILIEAEEDLGLEQASLANVQTEAAEQIVLARIRDAEARVAAARGSIERMKIHEAALSDAAFDAARAARESQRASEGANAEARAARRSVEPLSILVSRRTGQVHVRQGFGDLYEGTIEITEPERPFGTHVFTAMDSTADGTALRWSVVSVPTSGGDSPRRSVRSGDAAIPLAASTAGEALDRIVLPEEVRSLIGERLFPGASIIVTDFGLGETGQGTDFVILTR